MNFSGVARSKEAMPSGRHVRRKGIGGREQGGSGATLCYVLEQITGLFYVNQEQRGTGQGRGSILFALRFATLFALRLLD